MQSLLPLMLVPLLVWVAVWGYLWTLDGKVKRLQQEMQRVEQREEEDV
jgi:CcmD family protein